MKGDDSRIVKDPICGKDVDTLRARAVGIFGGVTYYFCSQECKAKYVDPRQPAPTASPPPRETGERRRETSERRSAEPEVQTEAPPVKYAHSRMRRVTGEVGTPVVQIDLSPHKKPTAAAAPPEKSAADDDLQPARSGRGWAWLAVVMLVLAGGVVFYMLKFR